MTRQNFAELFAARMLASEGIAAVWRLHVAAARAYQNRHLDTAETIIAIADSAEREWVRRWESGYSPRY